MRYTLRLLPALAIAIAVATLPTPTPLPAQQPPVTVTAEDYARAESFPGHRHLAGSSSAPPSSPTWLPGGRLLVPQHRTRRRGVRPGRPHRRHPRPRLRPRTPGHGPGRRHRHHLRRPSQLPFRTFELSPSGDALTARVGDSRLRCDLRAYSLRPRPSRTPQRDPDAITSPDGTKAAFIRDHNLWLRDLETGAETPLVSDGVEDYGYATNNAGWVKRDSPVLLWSPDSGDDRDLPARRPRRGHDAHGHHERGTPRAGVVEVPAAGRQPDLPHRPGGDPPGRSPGGAPADAPRPAPFVDHRPRGRAGRACFLDVEWSRRRVAVGLRVELARPQARTSCGWPIPGPATCATCSKRPRRASSSRVTAPSTGACSRRRTRSSGSRNGTTGGTSTATTSPPESCWGGLPRGTGTCASCCG